jgi:diacylglycerol kinase family enzyme
MLNTEPEHPEPKADPVKVKRIQLIANPASGSVGPNVRAEVEAILARHDVEAVVRTTADGPLGQLLKEALDAKPDLLVVVAGDGTARAAAEAVGPRGPLLAPLPGGTMNMLPGALYGRRDWKTALEDILADGEIRRVSGGTVDGHEFFVAAILGSPALWARAREAARSGKLWLAIARGRRALRQAFSGRLRFTLDGAERRKSEALTFMCPLVSKGIDNDTVGLEAAALDPAGALDVFRLALSAAAGDWRHDPSVQVTVCRQAYAWAGGRIPAILDGETVHLGRTALVRFKPNAFRALVPAEHGASGHGNAQHGTAATEAA